MGVLFFWSLLDCLEQNTFQYDKGPINEWLLGVEDIKRWTWSWDQCTLLRIWYYGRMKAKSRPSPKSLYHCLLIYMHLLYMFQPYLGKEIHYFTRRLGRKWTSQKNPIKIKKLNSIFDINFFSRKFNKVCKQSFFLEVLCLNW